MDLNLPCSHQAASESLAGTAPLATGWLLIRSEGAWGPKAVESIVSTPVREWATERGYKILLVRQHFSEDPLSGTQYWISHGTHGLVTGRISSFSDIPRVADATPAGPVFVICTNGARDQCCAVEGISLRKSLEAELSSIERHMVWEGTHIGGHRFAPTCLHLPGNLILGRLSVTSALDLIRHGDIPIAHVRGRSHLSPCHQVLEVNVPNYRSISWQDSATACPLSPHSHRGYLDGRIVSYELNIYLGATRPESCGGLSNVAQSLRFTHQR